MNKCANCGKETKNPKYCSRSCSASLTNKKTKFKHGKAIIKPCDVCGKSKKTWSNLCRDCFLKEEREFVIHKRTIKQIREKRTITIDTQIRENARAVYKRSKKNKICFSCGYSKHVEICHIKSISSFEDSTLISVVNNIKNLVPLCPNCHWEFDHGILFLDL